MSDTSPASHPEHQASYSLEILSEISGVSQTVILEYQQHGLLRAQPGDTSAFTDDTVHALRRLEHLREVCSPNLTGLKLLAQLLDEVERLRAELRFRR
jgi:DNA-binding transcriptional MerR regulator